MHISKHHGLRNDFLVVLDEANAGAIEAGPTLARRLCDRRAGLGADGLIHGARPAADSDADVVMHLWNADGGRAEMSGNGIRCLAQAVARARGVEAGSVVVESDTGRRELTFDASDEPHQILVRVDLGVVGPGPSTDGLALPFDAKEHATADLGNPHLVAWVEANVLETAALDVVGPEVEAHFADGINLEMITPGPAPDSLVLRVWERGAGITEACGTGACAAAHLAHQWGMVGTTVTVDMPGGSVVVDLVDGRAILRGPSVHVADIELSEGAIIDG